MRVMMVMRVNDTISGLMEAVAEGVIVAYMGGILRIQQRKTC